ncbi:hypothetical protein B0H15DRAFT_974525 [Mycena belliarum]|uniref:Uncharacterized protein n=1 Tax=Mycena belliarum TaxID=1033014 RepID=A0AAD6TMK3_9AGAR|nr:hypothetical protein B0H15DRAFT_974525 [Mycena belliae]
MILEAPAACAHPPHSQTRHRRRPPPVACYAAPAVPRPPSNHLVSRSLPRPRVSLHAPTPPSVVSALCRPLPTHPCAVSPLRSSEADTYKVPPSLPIAHAEALAVRLAGSSPPRIGRPARCLSPSPLPRHAHTTTPLKRSSARRLRTRTPSFATPPLPRCSTRRSRTPLQAQHPLAFCGTNASGHIICFPAIGVGSRRRARRPSPPSNPLPPRPCVPCPQPPARPAARTVSPANSRPKCARGSRIAAPSSLVRRLLLPPAIARDRLHRRRARPSVPVPSLTAAAALVLGDVELVSGAACANQDEGQALPARAIYARRMSSWAGKQEVANEAPAHDVGYVEAVLQRPPAASAPAAAHARRSCAHVGISLLTAPFANLSALL